MLFTLKKVLGALLMPVPIVFLIYLLAAILYRSQKRLALVCFGVATSGFYLVSLPVTAWLVAEPLEHRFAQYAGQAVDAVVVLGGYHRSDQRLPISSVLSATSMVRLSEGMRIARLNPEASLNLSGYNGRDAISNAQAMAQVAMAYGMSPKRITKAEEPKDTGDEAQHWAEVLKGQRVALVTTASHMPRAVYLFEQAGLRVIPAPTNFESGKPDFTYWKTWLPSAHALNLTTKAWHEHLGLIWAKLRA